MKTEKLRVLVLGADGMLGHKVFQVFRESDDAFGTLRGTPDAWRHHPLLGEADRLRYGVDARASDSVAGVIADLQPDVVINCIGVVKQLAEARDAILSIEVNALFPHRLAKMCEAARAWLVHMSTDCVFSGNREGAYRETDVPDPEGLYDRTKLLGEVAERGTLTLRTSLIGREIRRSTSLVEWFLSASGPAVNGYRHAIFSGFPTIAFARLLHDLAHRHRGLSGVFHVAASPISKYDLLLRLKRAFQLPVDVVACDEPRCNRQLDGSRFSQATGFVASSWDDLIDALVADPTPYDQWRRQHVVA